MYKNKILELKEAIINQAYSVEQMLANSINGLFSRDRELLNRIIEHEERVVNSREIEIDEICINNIALYSPEAKDLRIIFMIARMNSDLERMADHCVNISESALFLIDNYFVDILDEVKVMAEITTFMLKHSVTAFIDENAVTAAEVCKMDNEVDAILERVFRHLVKFMASHTDKIEVAMNIIRVAQNLEKIADLTTNISEETIYIAKGKVTKHRQHIG